MVLKYSLYNTSSYWGWQSELVLICKLFFFLADYSQESESAQKFGGCYVAVCFFEVLRYLSLIAILATTKKQSRPPCAFTKSYPLHRSFLTTLHSRQLTPWLHDHVLCLKIFTVHDNELRLLWANAFPLLILLIDLHIYLSMTRFGLSIEHINFPTSSGCAMCYATDLFF